MQYNNYNNNYDVYDDDNNNNGNKRTVPQKRPINPLAFQNPPNPVIQNGNPPINNNMQPILQ